MHFTWEVSYHSGNSLESDNVPTSEFLNSIVIVVSLGDCTLPDDTSVCIHTLVHLGVEGVVLSTVNLLRACIVLKLVILGRPIAWPPRLVY